MEGKKISRRSFLKVFGAGTVAVGTAGIAGCKDNPHTTKAQQEPPTDKMTYRVNPNTKDKVSLLGYPEWLTYTGTLLQDFYLFDTRVFSTYYRNPLSGRTAKFEQQYLNNYTVPSRISYPRAEMLGYDLGYFFVHGLAALGRDFDAQQNALPQQPVQHGFNFTRVGEQGGYVNTFVELVHYKSNKTIQLIK